MTNSPNTMNPAIVDLLQPQEGLMTLKVQKLDAKANALWEEIVTVTRELNDLGRERRRLNDMLPWWVAPGRRMIDSEGNLLGEVVWYPARLDFKLPRSGMKTCIRPSETDIERMSQNPFLPREETRQRQKEETEAYQKRLVEQKRARREVGLDGLKRRMGEKEYQRYDIRDELSHLADAGSHAAIAAMVLWDFTQSPPQYDGRFTLRGRSWALPGVLRLALPHCAGLLREHVRVLVKHPRKERRTFKFIDISDDARSGFIKIDADRIPVPNLSSPKAAAA